jgi:hypothetical protein
LTATATAGSGVTRVAVSLPVSSTIDASRRVGGGGGFFSTSSVGKPVVVYGDTAGNAAMLMWESVTTAAQTMNVSFTYQVI